MVDILISFLLTFGLIGLLVYLIVRAFKPNYTLYRCTNCGYEGSAVYGRNQFIELFLFLFFIIPWVLYRALTPRWVCAKCHSKYIVPISEITKKKKCPYCAEEILADAKICKHCGREIM